MAQAPFEIRIVGWEAESPSDPDTPVVTKAEVAQEVSAELRKHFDRHPLDPGARPIKVQTTPAEDIESVLNKGARRALQILREGPPHACEFDPGWVWQVVVVVPVGAFFVSLMTEAGKDAYKSLKRLTQRLYRAAARRKGLGAEFRAIELRDTDSGLIIDLPDRLPDRAYRQLLTITLPPLPKGGHLDRLEWFGERWILEIRMPVPDHDTTHDVRALNELPVLLVWQPTQRRWTLPPERNSLEIQ